MDYYRLKSLQMYFSCTNCDKLIEVWKDLAITLNKTEDEVVAIAKVDCSVEEDLCTGRVPPEIFRHI